MKNQINENNEIIATFMGYKYHTLVDEEDDYIGGYYKRIKLYSKIPVVYDYDEYDINNCNTNYNQRKKMDFDDYIIGNLNYHNSWNDLIPVLKKLSNISLVNEELFHRLDDILDNYLKFDILETYNSIIKVIKDLDLHKT